MNNDEVKNDEELDDEILDIGIEAGQFDVKAHEILPKMYLSYALSVIKDRALPDIRDGIKPVARRLLYGMHEMGLSHTKITKKSANITGTVMGKYHPHGSVYGAAARLVQPFTTLHPLIIGQGNFGSQEDPPAAERYTEMKLSKFSDMAILSDLDKDTVDFSPNYDGTLQEPKVLPTKIPLLLINGSVGIAVGMATSAPPHNLREVVDAFIAYIDDEDISIDELLKYIKGPDFPSGACMFDSGMNQIYETGRGTVTLRAKAKIIDNGKKQNIIITELPYQLSKETLITKLASLYQDKETKLQGIDAICGLKDESKADTRIVIELRKGAQASMVLNTLYRHTDLQCKHAVHIRALVHGEPKMVGLREIFKNFLIHRKDIVTRRTEFDLKNAEKRCHLLRGFLIVFDNLDNIIIDIKTSDSNEDTYNNLRKYGLVDDQIKSILDMKIQRIAQFERKTIIQEHDDIVEKIKGLKIVLESEDLIIKQIKDELVEIRNEFGKDRLTEILPADEDLTNIKPIEEIQEEDVVITVTKNGMIKRTPTSEYKLQKIKGRGLIGVDVKEGDYVKNVFQLSARDYTLVFTKLGKCYRMNVYQIPSLGRTAMGSSIFNILKLQQDDSICSIIPVKSLQDKTFVAVTKFGQIKRLDADKLQRPRFEGTNIISLNEYDELIYVDLLDSDKDILLVTQNGMSIRFDIKTIRVSGKSSYGMRAIKLQQDDFVVTAGLVSKDQDNCSYLMTVTDKGYSKRSLLKRFRVQRRGGRGIVCMDISAGKIIAADIVIDDKEQFILITQYGILIRLCAGQIRKLGRNTQGSRIQKLNSSDLVAAVAFLGIIDIDEIIDMRPADGGDKIQEDNDNDIIENDDIENNEIDDIENDENDIEEYDQNNDD